MDEVLRLWVEWPSTLTSSGGTGGIRGEGFAALSAGRRYGLWEGVLGEADDPDADTTSAAPLPTSSGVNGCATGVYGDGTPRDPDEPSSKFEGGLDECGFPGAGP
jgi:hypothetical protein